MVKSMQSLDRLKLEYENDKKKVKQIDNKLQALEKRKRTESKYGHKDTGDLEREIKRLHTEKKDLLKREQIIMKKMRKIEKKDIS
jgi:phage host-nuclease inhibitor protein Gam